MIGLDQGMGDLLDRNLDKGGGIIGIDDLDTCRKIGLQFGKSWLDGFGGIQGVGPGGQHDGHAAGRLAVEGAQRCIILATDFDPGDILEADLGAVAVDLQQDLGKLFRRAHLGLGHHAGVDLLAGNRGRAAQIADGNLIVLGLDSGSDIARSELKAVEFVGIKPDAHGVLTAEDPDAAHARGPAQWIAQGGDHEIGEIVLSMLPSVEIRPTIIRKVELDLVTWTPSCCTSCGKQGSGPAAICSGPGPGLYRDRCRPRRSG